MEMNNGWPASIATFQPELYTCNCKMNQQFITHIFERRHRGFSMRREAWPLVNRASFQTVHMRHKENVRLLSCYRFYG